MTTAERTRRNANQIKDGSTAATAVLYVFAVLICIITLYPMYYVVIKSISDPQIASGSFLSARALFRFLLPDPPG